jgi:DNA-binding IclR family transcriptional regulator
MVEHSSKRRIKTTDRVFEIINFVRQADGPTLTDIAQGLDISKGTVSLHLWTLVDLEYLVREGDTYRLSLRFLDTAEQIRQDFTLTEEMQPALTHLSEDSGEVSVVTVEEHAWCVTIGLERGPRAVQTFDQLGTRTHLHSHALGKAILSSMSNKEIERVIERRGLPSFTDKTITEPDVLFEEIEQTRERGFALDRGEGIEGLLSVATPVECRGERGAIGIAAPLNRMKEDTLQSKLPEMVMGAANEIELKCQH